MSYYQDQFSIHATAASGPVYFFTVILYSLAYDSVDVMDDNNLATVLSAQVQVIMALIGMVRK